MLNTDISFVYQSHRDSNTLQAQHACVQQRSWWFLAQFAGRIVSKKYLCLVIGDVGLPGYTDDISLPLQVWSRVQCFLTFKMVFLGVCCFPSLKIYSICSCFFGPALCRMCVCVFFRNDKKNKTNYAVHLCGFCNRANKF